MSKGLKAVVIGSLVIVVAPLIGMTFPAFDGLRGFIYLWIPLGTLWLLAFPVLVGWAVIRFLKGRREDSGENLISD